MITLKKLTSKDSETIKELFNDVFTNEPWNDDWSDHVQLQRYIEDLTGNVNSLTLGLYDGNDELVGLSLGSIIHWCTGTEYYIYEFCIRRDKQGRGLGTEFLNLIEGYVKPLNITHIYLQTERTVPAYGFYQKNGFVELQDHASLFKEFK